MGQTLAAWRTKVLELVRDETKKDLSDAQVDDVGIKPAIAKYSVDRPRTATVEASGAGSAYLSLPAGWVTGFSRLTDVEYPARRNPPVTLDDQSWQIVTSVADVTVQQILLDQVAATGQFVRLTYTLRWPLPDGTPTTDLIDDIAFEPVAALAASFCLVSLASQAARSRSGALPTDFTDGRERARNLMEASKVHRDVYNAFLGLTDPGDAGGSTSTAPASRRLDFDPQRGSLYHGGRR